MASIMALALSLPCSNIKTRTADPHCPRYNDEVDWSSVFSALDIPDFRHKRHFSSANHLPGRRFSTHEYAITTHCCSCHYSHEA